MPKKLFIILIFTFHVGFAQTNSGINKDEVIDRLIESIVEQNGEGADYTNLTEDLEYYFQNPININDANEEELRKLIILNEEQITQLLTYIKKHGELLSVYELALVKSWSQEEIFLILPFIKVETKTEKNERSFLNYIQNGRHEIIGRYQRVIENQAGFIEDSLGSKKYLGSPDQFYLRYKFSHVDKFSLGLTLKKDRGEEFFTGSNTRGFDFISGHILLKNIWKFQRIVIGDYSLNLGQGINMWKGFGFRKSVFSNSLLRFGNGINAYTSSNSNNYLRGVATELKLWKLNLTTFFSIDLKDISQDSINGELVANSILSTGLHRTNSEIENREKLTEIVTGGYLQYKHKYFHIGIQSHYAHYSLPFVRGSGLYNLYDFEGNYQVNSAIDYKAKIWNMFLFGELSLDKNGNYAFIQGIESNIGGNVRFTFLYRDYHKAYQNFQTNGFIVNSQNNNERGFYFGLNASVTPKISLRSYMDVFHFQWLRFNVDAPSWGYDGVAQINYHPTFNTEIYFRYKTTMKMENSTLGDTYFESIIPIYQHQFRLHAVYKILPTLTLRNRFEYNFIVRNDAPFNFGYVIYQDVNFNPKKVPLDINARFAIFKSTGFDNRLYAYENDLLYNFSVPFYDNEGFRWYLSFTYNPIGKLYLGARIAQFNYWNTNEIGSGDDLIVGNTKTEIKVQIRYVFGRKKQ